MNDSGFGFIYLPASASRLINRDVVIAIGGNNSEHLTLARFVKFTPSQSVADQLALILGQDTQYVDHEAIFGSAAGEGLVEENHLYSPASQFFQHYTLMSIATGQSVRA